MKPRNIKPCGLKNHGNMCFMNAVLQPLLHCTPFYNVIQQLQRVVPKQKTPLFNAFCTFFDKFEKNYSSSTKSKRSFLNALDAEDIYDALRTKSSVHFKKGGQEDAEEFLRFILDELHEELLHARQSAYNSKMATTLLTEVTESPIMQIFGGKMRTILKAFGEKDKAMLEPFMGLPLDIAPDFVSSIEDGLLNFTAPEVISGYKTGTGSTVDLTKQSFMDSFPRVLIVHLKRFVFDAKIGTTQKLRKHIRFSTVLKIHPDVASPARREENQSLEYKLLAVVNHHGKCAEGGHYTCDVYRKKNEWLHIDDEHVENISEAEAEMTKERDDRQAYMLFYSKV
ncbi:cysteine proteinase [Chytriomyces cf. hyalinus JEL632]|nr:cysteine proteinase [Chytriomyces cf. hyalinus JEL632]